jgi:mono/diheme cytochrome c family protein
VSVQHPAQCAAFVVAGVLAAGVAYAQNGGQEFDQIERGRYLTIMGDCVACHTAEGGKPFAGGLTVETPFGALISPNITPDPTTGIGNWTDADFLRAMHDGIDRQGRHLYPAFPYVYYTRVTDQDVLAIRAYLATLEPVVNKVVSNQLPFPFDVREGLVTWNDLNFRPGVFKPDPAKTPEWNRGAYIVTGLEHCGLCHTPKTVSGGDKNSDDLQGAALEGWYAPNITGDKRTGVGDWSVDQIAEYLRNGHNSMAAASGPMREEIENSSSKLTDADLHAIAVYLKDLPGQGHAVTPIAADTPAMQAGQAIYVDECSACHTRGGAGIPRLLPALKGAASVQQDSAISLIRVVLQGAQSAQTAHAVTGPAMPALGWKLSDEQVADVVTYIRNSWGNAAPAASATDVKAVRADLAKRTD